MQTLLTFIGFLLLVGAIMGRLQLWEDYEDDLESANQDKRTAVFWHESEEAKEADERIAEIEKSFRSWKTRLKRGAFFWPLGIIGAALLFMAWLSQPQSDGLNLFPLIIFVGAVWAYQTSKVERKIKSLEGEVRWLTNNLRRAITMTMSNRNKLLPPDDLEKDLASGESLGDILGQALAQGQGRKS